MGKSDKDKKRRRSSDSDSDESYTSSSSESDRDEEKRRDKKRKKHKKDKDRKEKSKDKDKKSSKSKSKDDLVKQARAFLEQQLGGAGAGAGAGAGGSGGPSAPSASAGAGPLPPVQVSEVKEPITTDDYFRRHAEFAAFLAEERRTQFNELSSERSHELFEEFVRIWNEGRLPARYYAGMVAAPSRRTEYRWNLKGSAAGAGGGGRPGGGAMGMAAFMEDQRAMKQDARLDGRRKDRALAKELLEDIAPKETGRDKLVAERAARRQLARQDDDGPGGYLPGGGRGEDSLMGGDDSFAAAKAREAKRQELARQRGLAKMEDVAQRTAAFQAKEDEKLAGLRALLAKGPITIAKRT
ncbi:hypothetical protein HYH02_011228 [Chlamydomonas schloesseri]|uniref:Uncharacterized protein n=1 Tax=Chlamydomonas schloesseri TaxID=2026947 RepID=A0A835T2G5_9CHLO|nr:hypothetical protein HYH02_011228 [Chlamydomonas schloesseri]|eukprot:KAG2437588.1 hypothetical protein HYH02_011228 [Chlamydomonas schloesseri]